MPLAPDTVFTQNWLVPLFNAEDAMAMPIALKAAASNATYPEYAAGMLLGEILATPGIYAPYNPNAIDGTQTPKVINRVQVSVDASGNIIWPGDFQASPSTHKFIDAYRSGTFKLDQIIGLDAAALTAMAGTVKEGFLGTNEKDTVALSAATNTFDLAITGADGVLHTFLAIAGNVTAAALQTLLQATLGIGSVGVTLSGTTYTFVFGGAFGNQPVTIASTPHTITSTDTQVTAGAAATVAAGTHGIVQFGV